jgi:uncharacterized membrane protein
MAVLTTIGSGYFRVTDFGKGAEFYLQEPLFKMVFVGIWVSSSLFPTIMTAQRTVEKQKTGHYPPMSEQLSERMKQVFNAELHAILTIPVVATLMSRGLLNQYKDEIPWQIGAAVAFLCTGVFAFKYVNEALTWTDEEEAEVPGKANASMGSL